VVAANGSTGIPLAALRDLCDSALHRLSEGPAHQLVTQIHAKLNAPLRVTVAGGVSAGKSTLVNALMGQRIAAVDAGECTRVVTEYRYDVNERVEVIGVDGRTDRLALVGAGLPESLGRPHGEIATVVVHLSNALLRELSIVDTPGLNTVTQSNEQTTAQYLGIQGPGIQSSGIQSGGVQGLGADSQGAKDTAVAISKADALLFVLPLLRQADAEALLGFAKLFGATDLSSASSVAVLSRIDRLARSGDGSFADPLSIASPIAARVADKLRGVVSEVVPVVGLLAETASAAVFTEDDARALIALAQVHDELDREDMLLSAEDFVRFDRTTVSAVMRHRLLSMLDLYGLHVGLAAVDNGATGASALIDAFATASGFSALRRSCVDRFAARSDTFKAHAALADLRRVCWLRSDTANAKVLRQLRSELERVELDPTLHHLRLLDVAHKVSVGELMLPDHLLADVLAFAEHPEPAGSIRMLADGSSQDDARAALSAGASRWAVWMNDPRRSPSDVRHARTVKEAFELAWVSAGL
jgi:hypothetical protein